jgi:hypothetical protein
MKLSRFREILKEELYLFEAKQVGTLVHYTTYRSALLILQNNSLNATGGENEFSFKNYHKTVHRGRNENEPVISLTRTKNKVDFDIADEADVALIIDGDKLSNNYKIIPFHDYDSPDDEREERIYGKNISPLSNYLKGVMIYIKEKKFFAKDGRADLSKLVKYCESHNIKYGLTDDPKDTIKTLEIKQAKWDREREQEEMMMENQIQFNNWVVPSLSKLKQEYHVENDLKGNNYFDSEEEFLNAVKKGKIITVTPQIDNQIDYRSQTADEEELLDLIKSYRSYPEFRNEKTLEGIYSGFQNNKPMEYPIVIEDPTGYQKIISGNTRMDAAFHLEINPKIILIKTDNEI